jgi:hypothetical protein
MWQSHQQSQKRLSKPKSEKSEDMTALTLLLSNYCALLVGAIAFWSPSSPADRGGYAQLKFESGFNLLCALGAWETVLILMLLANKGTLSRTHHRLHVALTYPLLLIGIWLSYPYVYL